ncbi:hypothetical protein [Mycolicibacillus koreensis]|nr:hypothetical protein [Mycolicibacillus koreensis]
MATRETSEYKNYRSSAVPFTDPIPALRTIGFTGSNAILLSGYGDDEASALRGVMLQGHRSLLDCSYTLYGASTLHADAGFNLVSVVLAAP